MAITKIRSSSQLYIDSNLNVNSNRIINLASPIDATDAVNKEYVDNMSAGLDSKASVKYKSIGGPTYWASIVSTSNPIQDNAYFNGTNGIGATIRLASNVHESLFDLSGHVIAVGDRVLVSDGALDTNAYINGIYTVTSFISATGFVELTRAFDFNTVSEVSPGSFVFVEMGTVYADSGWTMISDAITAIGDPINGQILFTQFSGAGQIIGGAGLAKSGNTLSVNVDNSTIEIVSDSLRVKDSGITNSKLANSYIQINGSNIQLGGSISNLALTTNGLNQFASTTPAQLASVISSTTGTDTLVFANTPTLSTPKINTITGVLTADNISLYGTSTGTISVADGGASAVSIGGSALVLELGNNATQVNLGSLADAIVIGSVSSEIYLSSASITDGGMLYVTNTGNIASATYYGTPVTGASVASWSGDIATFTQPGASSISNIQVWVNGLLMKISDDYTIPTNAGGSFTVDFTDGIGASAADNIQAAYIWK